jgi:hypothetical protein
MTGADRERSPKGRLATSLRARLSSIAVPVIRVLLRPIPTGLLVRILLRRLSKLTSNTWEIEYPNRLDMNSLTRINSEKEGRYTGRMAYIQGPTDMRVLGVRYSDDSFAVEHEFRKWLEVEGFRMMNIAEDKGIDAMLGMNWKTKLDTEEAIEVFTTLMHEHTHWRILTETTMSALIDRTGWRVRVMQMLLCDQIHGLTDIPYRLDAKTVKKLRAQQDELMTQLDELSKDRQLLRVFSDLVSHTLQAAFYYQDVVGPLLETVTWTLVETTWPQKMEDHLGRYFSDEDTRELGRRVWKECMSYIEKNGRDHGRDLIDNANWAFDFPLQEEAVKRLLGSEVRSHLPFKNYVIGRFEKLLENRTVSRAPATDKPFSKILAYAIKPPKIPGGSKNAKDDKEFNELLLKGAVRILKEEPAVIRYGAMMAARSSSKPAAGWSTVFVDTLVNNKYHKLRYDELTGLTPDRDSWSPIGKVIVKRTGEVLNRIDDVVGHLPSTLGATILLGYYLRRLKESELHPEELMAVLQELLNDTGGTRTSSNVRTEVEITLSRILDLGNLINYAYGGTPNTLSREYRHYAHVAIGLRDRVPVKLYRKIEPNPKETGPWQLDEEDFREFLWFWLELITELGESARYFWGEHGMWS